jgi:hypothetical protein
MDRAWLWTANPDLWASAPPTAGTAALGAYLLHASRLVYWATPKLEDEIAEGDRAYIWRTRPQNGIVAVGVVTEAPRPRDTVDHPERLAALGWDEGNAKSSVKTGITIQGHRWNAPLRVPGLMVRATVNRVDEEARRRIEALL